MSDDQSPFEALAIGQTAAIEREVTVDDLYLFARASGNLNPLHLPAFDIDGDKRSDAVAPSMFAGALVSSVLGNILPGPGTLYRSQALSFRGRAQVGDKLKIQVTVTGKGADREVTLATTVNRLDGTPIADGEAVVIAPAKRMAALDAPLPKVVVKQFHQMDRLVEACESLPPLRTAVVAPEESAALGGALLAAKSNLIQPILVGNAARMAKIAAEMGADLSSIEVIDIADHAEAAARSVALVHEGKAQAVMKGHLHTDELLAHVVKREGGLRTNRRLSHVFVIDVPDHEAPLIVSDAAINIAPDLEAKVDIIQNAIDCALALGIAVPMVGVLSAVETVTPKMPSTLDAAILSKMADRGQIKGGMVDGPLAMDNAINLEAARTKGIGSVVAGHAEVLIVPNIEAGNMLVKQLTFLAGAEAAGLVLGAKVPVMLTSRSDNDRARLCSCAVAVLVQHWRETGESAVKA